LRKVQGCEERRMDNSAVTSKYDPRGAINKFNKREPKETQ